MSGDYAYDGANYGLDPEHGTFSSAYSPNFASSIGLSTDPRTANVLKAASEKLSSGAKVIEVTQLSPEVFESIPKEHFKELNKLRKLVGDVELTLHAPVIEPTGMTKRGWDPYEREQAERQMLNAVEKAHDLNPEGNVVTTFHSSAIGIPAETIVWEEKDGKKIPITKEALVIDERTGDIAPVSARISPFEAEKKVDIKDKIEKLNRDNWFKTLQHINYAAEQGARTIEQGLAVSPEIKEELGRNEKRILNLYKDYAEGSGAEVKREMKKLGEIDPEYQEALRDKMQTITHGDIYLRDAYNGLRDLFDQAYITLEKSEKKEAKQDLMKLEKFRQEIAPKMKYLQDPEKVGELAETIREGVHVLRSIKAPEVNKPFGEFAIEKSSETFSNVALSAYNKYKGNTPIISIENPPAGFALSSAEELKQLIDKSREKFAEKAADKYGWTKEKAKNEAEKLIGATWDLGHINMIRKYGAGEKEVVGETKKIAPYVKHMHLSDNFGLEHTELPMGMGNVPTKEMMKSVMEHNKKFKKIAEAGNWYQHFQTTPFAESLQHFNSPIYAMKSASYWGPQSYFAGYGMNPEIHHSMYGAGFANLPVELGGQMAGKSRVSGAPID